MTTHPRIVHYIRHVHSYSIAPGTTDLYGDAYFLRSVVSTSLTMCSTEDQAYNFLLMVHVISRGQGYQMRKGVCQHVKLASKMILFDYFSAIQVTFGWEILFLSIYYGKFELHHIDSAMSYQVLLGPVWKCWSPEKKKMPGGADLFRSSCKPSSENLSQKTRSRKICVYLLFSLLHQ